VKEQKDAFLCECESWRVLRNVVAAVCAQQAAYREIFRIKGGKGVKE